MSLNKINPAMKYLYNTPFLLACVFSSALLSSCTEKTPAGSQDNAAVPPVTFEHYTHKGLDIAYPSDWSLLHDEPGIIADRTVAFETKDASRITTYFYKSQALSYSELANSLEQQLRLNNSDNVKHFQRHEIDIADYKGVQLSWTKLGLSETKTEITILQWSAQPYPVLVQFHLFDGDIESQSTNIVPFMQGISFNFNGVQL